MKLSAALDMNNQNIININDLLPKDTGSDLGLDGNRWGNLFLDKFIDFQETSVPSAPGANEARLLVRDNGSGKTQLVILFPSGSAIVIATEV